MLKCFTELRMPCWISFQAAADPQIFETEGCRSGVEVESILLTCDSAQNSTRASFLSTAMFYVQKSIKSMTHEQLRRVELTRNT